MKVICQDKFLNICNRCVGSVELFDFLDSDFIIDAGSEVELSFRDIRLWVEGIEDNSIFCYEKHFYVKCEVVSDE